MSDESKQRISDFLEKLCEHHEVRKVEKVGFHNLYMVDGKEVIYITYSIIHSPPHYFFGVPERLSKFLKQSDNACLLLICGDIRSYFKIEFKKIYAIFSHLPTAADGSWKIHVSEQFRLTEGPHLKLPTYLDRYGLFGSPGTPADDDIEIPDEDEQKKNRAEFLKKLQGGFQ